MMEGIGGVILECCLTSLGWLSQQAEPVLTHYSSQIKLQLLQHS